MKHYKPIKCVVCSKTFTPTAANQNTCCEAHRQQRATELRKSEKRGDLKESLSRKTNLRKSARLLKVRE